MVRAKRRGSVGLLGLVASVLVCAILTGAALAAAGQLDSSFSGDGKRTTSFGNTTGSDTGNDVAIQANGRIVVAGSSTQSGTGNDFALARYRADGSLDQSFSSDGKRTTGFANGAGGDLGHGVAIQSDGRIVVAGQSDQGVATGTDFALARFMPNGTLDQSFSNDGRRVPSFATGGALDSGRDVAIQPNGRIVVAGLSYQSATGYDFAVARFMPDGNLDQSFSGDGRRVTTFGSGFNTELGHGVAIQPNGRIVVAGESNQGATGDDLAVARFMPDGNLDQSFSANGKRTTTLGSGDDVGYAVAIQGNGRIVVAGHSDQGAAGDDLAVVRFRSDGTLDPNFSGDGKRLTSFANGNGGDSGYDVAIQPNGRIVVAGYSDQSGGVQDFALARFRVNGSLDQSFSGDGKRVTSFGSGGDEGNAVAIQPNGRIVVAGYSSQSGTGNDFAIARLLGG